MFRNCWPALAVLLISVASAQSQDEPDPEIETLVIASPAGAWGAAGSTNRLEGQDLADASFVHPYEALARLPGAWVSRGSGQEHLTALRSPVLTGPGSCGAFLILEQDIPIRPAGFCNVNNLFETALELADGLEVALGPAAATWGGNALHGALNLQFDTEGSTGDHWLKWEAGPWQYGATTWRWHNRSATAPASLGFFAASDGGYRQQAGYGQQKLRLAKSWTGGGADLNWSLTAANLEQETAGYIVGEDSYRAADEVRRRNENPEAFRDASALRTSLHRRAELPGGVADLRAWLRHSQMEFLQHFLPCTPLERNGHQSLGASWQRSYRSERGELVWGLLGEIADVHLDQYQSTAPSDCGAFNPERFSQGWHYDYQVNSQNLAIWGRGRHGLGDDASLLWDLRLEQLDYDYDSALPAGPADNDGTNCGGLGCRYSRPADGRDRFSPTGSRLAMAFRPEGWQWHLALASGYRPPQIGELYRLQQGQQTTDLRPEQLVQLEWGGRWQSEALQTSWALWAADKKHVIFRDSTRAILPDGATDHLGAELHLKAKLSAAHALQLALTLSSHRYGFSASTFDRIPVNSGDEVDTAPGELASLLWRWRPTNRLQLETEWLYTGAYYTDAANEHSYPGHSLLNLRLTLKPLPKLSLHLRLHNALDTAYANRADHTSFGGDRYFPGLPRALYASVRWDFAAP